MDRCRHLIQCCRSSSLRTKKINTTHRRSRIDHTDLHQTWTVYADRSCLPKMMPPFQPPAFGPPPYISICRLLLHSTYFRPISVFATYLAVVLKSPARKSIPEQPFFEDGGELALCAPMYLLLSRDACCGCCSKFAPGVGRSSSRTHLCALLAGQRFERAVAPTILYGGSNIGSQPARRCGHG